MKPLGNWLFAGLLFFSLNSNGQDITFSLDWVKTGGGGTSNDFAHYYQRDKMGNHFLAGSFDGECDFDPGPGVVKLSSHSAGWTDGFVLKLDPNGNFLWVRRIGGLARDYVHGISLDDSGNIYAVGNFQSVCDFDHGTGTHELLSQGSWDAYLLKLNANGDFGFVRQFGGVNFEAALGVVVNDSGIYISGNYNGTCDFDPDSTLSELTSKGSADLFLVRLTHSGDFIWAKSFGGPSHESGCQLTSDSKNNLIIYGNFNGNCDVDPDTSEHLLFSPDAESSCVVKLSPGGKLIWAYFIKGLDFKVSHGNVICTKNDEIYLCGVFGGNANFNPLGSPYILKRIGGIDGYLVKLSEDGKFKFVRQIGGAGIDYINNIYIKPNGNILAVGDYSLTCNFNPYGLKYELTTSADYEMSFMEFDDTGGFYWAGSCPTGVRSSAVGISTDNSGNIFITGWFSEDVDFDPSPKSNFINSTGGIDFFIMKMKQPLVSIHPIGSNNFSVVHPNPVSDILNININTSGTYIAEILDYNGRIISSLTDVDHAADMNISGLISGTYFLRVKDQLSGKIAISRFIKE